MLPQFANPANPGGMVSAVNVYTNDPEAKGLSLEQVTPPEGPWHFSIPGWTGAGGLFDPGTPEFQAGHLTVVLASTFSAWCDFFGVNPAWQPGIGQLPILPRAGKDLNAYYDRTALKFFFNPGSVIGKTIYACESSDVVAHECGHAILDAEHPDYWDSLLGETGAFHEAFGDISAMLVTLGDPKVRAAMLAENGGDLSKSNAVSRLAEQLARAISDAGHPEAVVSANALRDAVNVFKYRAPDKLPGSAPASKLSSESHNFSRVFSGGFYDLLVGIYTQLRQADTSLSGDAALAQARSEAGHLIAQGLLLAPKGDAPFKTIASSMLTANAKDFGGKYFDVLKKTFVGRRVLTAKEADALKGTQGAVRTETSALGGTASVSIGTPFKLGIAQTQSGQELPSNVRKKLKLPRRDFRLVRDTPKRDDGSVLHFVAPREMELKGRDLGPARGAVVTVTDAVSLHVDPEGRVLSANQHKVDKGQEKRIQDHVAKLVQRDRVYDASKEGSIDPSRLIALKQPYYLAYDKDGKKRIRRAFIACHF
ncbi:MAG: hypothetical protein ACM3S0_08065 [Acidobacteriota bacterium]